MDPRFKIIEEETIQFKDGKKLFVIRTQEGNRSGIEVSTTQIGFGRRTTPNQNICRQLFTMLVDHLRIEKNQASAIKTVRRLFKEDRVFMIYIGLRKLTDQDPVINFLQKFAGRKNVTVFEISAQMTKFGVDSAITYNFAGTKQKLGYITLRMFKNDQLLGMFIGKRFSKKYDFFQA